MWDMTDRIALITGGSRGLGRATALALADAGVDVVLTYLANADAAEEVVAAVRQRGRTAVALKLDTADTASFPAFVDALRDVLPNGRLDVLSTTRAPPSTRRSPRRPRRTSTRSTTSTSRVRTSSPRR